MVDTLLLIAILLLLLVVLAFLAKSKNGGSSSANEAFNHRFDAAERSQLIRSWADPRFGGYVKRVSMAVRPGWIVHSQTRSKRCLLSIPIQ